MKTNPKGSSDAFCTGKPDIGKKASHKKERARTRTSVLKSEFPEHTSTYSWCESGHPFVIMRKQKQRMRKCPCCRKEFDKIPPEMDLIVLHRENDLS